jgi:hypothetical protein
MTAEKGDPVPALPLNSRRRALGYIVPFINAPITVWNAYSIAMTIVRGEALNTPEFMNDVILLIMGLFLVLYLPRMAPIYTNRYWFMENELKISRFLWGTARIPYKSIARAEVYIRDDSSGPVSKEALKSSRDSIEALRRSGFKINDCTNSEGVIALIVGEKSAHMISPAYQKAFIQKLRKKVGTMPVKLVELNSKGKRVRELPA